MRYSEVATFPLLILASSGDLWWQVPVFIAIVFAIVLLLWFLLALLLGPLGIDLEDKVNSATKAVRESDWYKAREERKQIEDLQRKLLRKRLEDELKE